MQFIFLFICYLLGSIPTGVWYSKIKHQIDVRELGSGNSGATNIGRNFGFKAAIFVTVIDVLKGLVAMILAHYFYPNTDWVIMGAGIAAILGHAYPIFANFRGGKVVATSFAVLAGYNFFIGLSFVLLLFLLIYLTSTISLAALTSFSLAALYVLITQPLIFGLGFIAIAAFMIYRHRTNVVRLMKGEESRINFGLRKPTNNN
ncbi:glycerol-3-phosphate 1-O-acyltransferase PlsY [Globicatella sanguinis]|uniref:glycerol-3-phosphate 1-O-acyltransferase PlsY n=1 Tax=Globicatella sanguinis TaxID=13076 RepID=UPI0008247377|nr:glycerol-3-phosphate 1-O-acyltransferase PlsY [Globicatella sanguinis]MDK7631515.1 glycerol-3-phosphate 1-O-acyltransferase PlsY [Globicatella sanguinis]WIK66810.1 glycerol-3-phosphate 1-O-acyltransferase PlsY [Globicatella sanguinis]WKT56215.1 glycerol-3-phosphate 1-O-acyltransferase PlsY [Globicatella sanguinis]